MTFDHRCPKCNKVLFRAPAPVDGIQLPCKRCGIVTAEYAGHVVQYRCSRCGRSQTCERPAHDRTFCINCGTRSLTILRPAEAPTPVDVAG